MSARQDTTGDLIRRELGRGAGNAKGECPDPAMLAAYCEKNLSTAEVAQLERHFAICDRCQAQLAAMARIDGVVGEPKRKDTPAVHRRWDWRWAGPVAGLAAAALILIMVLQRPPQAPSTQLAANEAPGAPPELAATEPESAPLAAAQPEVAPPAAAKMAAPAPVRAANGGAFGGVNMRSPRTGTGRAGDEAPAVTAAAAEPKAAAGSAAGAVGSMRSRSESAQAQTILITSADNKTTWRIGAGNHIFRTTDGVHWTRRALPAGAPPVAGSSPSRDVCWLVGNAGTILRTADGLVWVTVPPPEQIDFVTVQASGDLSAAVTAADGRRFATSDGGGNWRRLPE